MFKKYSSIDNSYRSKTIKLIDQCGFSNYKYDWCVLNKVHGANASFVVNVENSEVDIAKRTSVITNQDGNFNNHELILQKYRHRCLAMVETMIADNIEIEKTVQIYGELFGGQYDHPDVKKDKNAKRVQKGVQYCPQNEFYAFDVMIDGKYLAYDEATIYLQDYFDYYAKPLMIGTFEDCLKYPNDFQDPLFREFDLPRLKDNITEGVVIKPWDNVFHFDGGSRVILKNKNDSFKEKQTKSEPKVEIQLSEKANELLNVLNSLINENRLRNVLSKMGEINQKDFGKIIGLFVGDVMEEFNKDYSLDVLEKDEQKFLKKKLGKLSANQLRKHWLDILDGEF